MKVLTFSRLLLGLGLVIGIMVFWVSAAPNAINSGSLIGGYVPISVGTCCEGVIDPPENNLCTLLWPPGGGDRYDCEGAIVICDTVSDETGETCQTDGYASCGGELACPFFQNAKCI